MTVGGIIKSAIVTAFSIAVALIWKDLIIETIELFFPASEAFYFKILIAVIATIVLIIIIYTVLKTENEAEQIFKRFKG